MVSKSSPSTSLLTAIRAVARSPRTLPRVSLRTRREVAAGLDAADHAILAMRLDGDPPAEIGQTLGVSTPDITNRISAIIGRLERNGSGG